MPDTPEPIRAKYTAYAKADRDAAFIVYASLDQPSVKQTAEIMGISPRTVEAWCTADRWVERRAERRLDRVATASSAIDVILLRQAQRLAENLLSLAFGDDPAIALRATTHALGLLGKSPVTKTASVVQHLRDSGSRREDTRTVEELRDALHASIAALGEGGSLPESIKERGEKDEDERGPTIPSATMSDFDDHDDDDDDDGEIIEAEFRDSE